MPQACNGLLTEGLLTVHSLVCQSVKSHFGTPHPNLTSSLSERERDTSSEGSPQILQFLDMETDSLSESMAVFVASS